MTSLEVSYHNFQSNLSVIWDFVCAQLHMNIKSSALYPLPFLIYQLFSELNHLVFGI